MGRLLYGSLLCAICFAASAQGAPAVVVAKTPSLACPQTELGDADLQARYATMWERYNKSIEEAGRTLRDEIEAQTKSATGVGNLDLALFWKAMAKEFEQKGELRWDEASLKKGWDERFGDSPYPSRFSVAVKKASEAFAAATSDLERGYSDLVAEFTKSEKLEEALKVRGELKELLASISPTPKPDPKPEPKPEPKPNPALQGAIAWNGHKYKVFKESCSWHDAKKRCEEMGGHLVIINDEGEQNAVVHLLVRSGVPIGENGRNWDGVWLGATDQVKEGEWKWVDNSPVRFHRWATRQPDGGAGSNYAGVMMNHGGRWDDSPPVTDANHGFICEWDE